MFYQAADIRHEKQIDELMTSFGKFVVEFERVCSAFQYLTIFCLQNGGLKNHRLAQVVIGDKSAAELRVLFSTLYQELPEQDKTDRKSVKALINRFEKLTTFRNNLVHAEWHLGSEAGDDELDAVLSKFKNKPTKGSEQKRIEITKSLIDKFALEARKQMVLVRRLEIALLQSGFKTSEHMNRFNDCMLEEGLFAGL